MLNSSAANVIKTHLMADPITYLKASYATWVISAKAATKAVAHVLQCVRPYASCGGGADAARQVYGHHADRGVNSQQTHLSE